MGNLSNVLSSDTLKGSERADLVMHNDGYEAPCLCSSVRSNSCGYRRLRGILSPLSCKLTSLANVDGVHFLCFSSAWWHDDVNSFIWNALVCIYCSLTFCKLISWSVCVADGAHVELMVIGEDWCVQTVRLDWLSISPVELGRMPDLASTGRLLCPSQCPPGISAVST